MANGVKVYSIKINGIESSIKDVNKLSESLENLDTVAAKSGSGSSSSMSSEMKDATKSTEKLAKEYEKLNSIISGQRDEVMKLHQLQKDATNARKADMAAARLEADDYGNTMAGLKEKLADIKHVMQFAEIGSNEFNTLIVYSSLTSSHVAILA